MLDVLAEIVVALGSTPFSGFGGSSSSSKKTVATPTQTQQRSQDKSTDGIVSGTYSQSSSTKKSNQAMHRQSDANREGSAGFVYGAYDEGKNAQIARNQASVEAMRENRPISGRIQGFLYKSPTRVKGVVKIALAIPAGAYLTATGYLHAVRGVINIGIGTVRAVGATLATPIIGMKSARENRQKAYSEVTGGASMVITGIILRPLGGVAMAAQGAYNLVTGRESSWKMTGGVIDQTRAEIAKVNKTTEMRFANQQNKERDIELTALREENAALRDRQPVHSQAPGASQGTAQPTVPTNRPLAETLKNVQGFDDATAKYDAKPKGEEFGFKDSTTPDVNGVSTITYEDPKHKGDSTYDVTYTVKDDKIIGIQNGTSATFESPPYETPGGAPGSYTSKTAAAGKTTTLKDGVEIPTVNPSTFKAPTAQKPPPIAAGHNSGKGAHGVA